MMVHALHLRRNPTLPERAMWRLLHPFRTDGFHFRKQARIGPYVADIACHHARVVIEVDGHTHGTDEEMARDRRRDAFLRGEGYTVLRFSNADVLRNPGGVFEMVSRCLEGRPRNQRSRRATSGAVVGGRPLPGPPHEGEGAPTAGLGGEARPHPGPPPEGEGAPSAGSGGAGAAGLSNTLPLVGRVGEGA